MAKWRYHTQNYHMDDGPLEKWLDALGALGWECCAVTPGTDMGITWWTFIFKRPREEEQDAQGS